MLKKVLEQGRETADIALEQLLPPASQHPTSIHQAMRHSVFAGGKRLRPILCMEAGRMIAEAKAGNSKSATATAAELPPGIEQVGAALEMLHTYSLIHDDLPALDNDDLRRGRPTSHRVFGEAMAILAGDSLLTLAFEVLSRLPHIDAERKIRLVEELARASGTVGGMIGGQVNDIEGEKKVPTAFLLESIHRAKTGALLRASLRMGAIYAGATADELAALSEFGERVGLAFQIIDDVLDVEESSEKLGKTAGKDIAQQKITFPAVYGLDRSRQMAEEERLAAHLALRPLDERAKRLRELADFIVHRRA